MITLASDFGPLNNAIITGIIVVLAIILGGYLFGEREDDDKD